jgi:hypothetical protein
VQQDPCISTPGQLSPLTIPNLRRYRRSTDKIGGGTLLDHAATRALYSLEHRAITFRGVEGRIASADKQSAPAPTKLVSVNHCHDLDGRLQSAIVRRVAT